MRHNRRPLRLGPAERAILDAETVQPGSEALIAPQLAQQTPPDFLRDKTATERSRNIAVVPEPDCRSIGNRRRHVLRRHVLRRQPVQPHSSRLSLLTRLICERAKILLRDHLEDGRVRIEHRCSNVWGEVHEWPADLSALQDAALGQPPARDAQSLMDSRWDEQAHRLQFSRECSRRCDDGGVLIADDRRQGRYSLLNSGCCRPTSSRASCNASLPPMAASWAFCSSFRRGSPFPRGEDLAVTVPRFTRGTVAVAIAEATWPAAAS